MSVIQGDLVVNGLIEANHWCLKAEQCCFYRGQSAKAAATKAWMYASNPLVKV